MTAASSFHDEPQPTEPAREIVPFGDAIRQAAYEAVPQAKFIASVFDPIADAVQAMPEMRAIREVLTDAPDPREITPGADIPRPPKGYQTCNVHDGRQDLWAKGARRQVNHLVAVPTSGPTLCGLTRFGKDADLPGWSMGGGVSGPSIVQAPCPACWQAVEAQ